MSRQNHIELISAKLRKYDRGRRSLSFLRGVAEAALVFCGGLLAVVLIEWLFKTQQGTRIALSLANLLLAFGWFVWRAAWPALRSRPLQAIAEDFERAFQGRFNERILFAVTCQPQENQFGTSAWMAQQTISLAAKEVESVKPLQALDRTPVKRAWVWTAALATVLCLACIFPSVRGRLALAISPQASSAVLSRIQLAVAPGNLRIRQGTPVEVTATTSEPVDQARVLVTWDDGFRETVPMFASGTNRYSLTLGALAQGFKYQVEADDAQSPAYAVHVDLPPRISRMQVEVQPPSYSMRPNSILEGGNADFLSGSTVRLILETTGESVTTAEWIPDAEPPGKLQRQGPLLKLDTQPTNSLAYQVRLVGANGLQSEPSRKWQWRMLPDLLPAVRLQSAASESRMVEGSEVLRFDADATDDVGLKSVDLLILHRDNEAQSRKLLGAGSSNAVTPLRNFKTGFNFNLADLQVATGEAVQFQLAATDLKGQVNQTDPVSVVAGSVQKTLQAQLAARIKRLISGLDTQLDQLQQTRASWLSLARNYRPGDAQAHQPAVTLLRSRLNEFSREIAAIGSALVLDSETNALQDSRFMYRLGTTINAWGEQQRDVLLATCAGLDPSSTATNSLEVFNRGRGLFTRAISDMEEYRRVLSVLGGALDTEVMSAQADSAKGRYKRALPVLRGEKPPPSTASSTGPGLLGTFFEGTQLRGAILEQSVNNARLENYAPAGKASNWSCRYEGDIQIPSEDEWTLGCIADDGIRLSVNGKHLLPERAWSAQSPTEYKANVRLAAGWHPVVIEFFQGDGTSKLQLMAGKKDQPWQEVRIENLRPPAARQPRVEPPKDPALEPIVAKAVKDRLRASLQLPVDVPPAVAPMTNFVRNDHLMHLVREKLPTAHKLGTNLLSFAEWKDPETRQAETQADDLVAFARTSADILRQELEKVRWRYEGAESLKKVQNAIQELREIQQEIARLPNHSARERSEEEQVRLDTAKIWQMELDRSVAQVAHDFFEVARQKDATLAQRTLAYNAAAKANDEMKPAVGKLGDALEKDSRASQIASQMDQRLNEINDRFRELNDLQERMNREQVAATARKALPDARAFARAQAFDQPSAMEKSFAPLADAVKDVQKAQRRIGDYNGAQKLQTLTGDSPQLAKSKELAAELRSLASQTDNNPPSLAQAIPPPIQQQVKALDAANPDQARVANELARPRLAMSLEAARLLRQRDARTSAAYEFLGQDLGELLEKPGELASKPVRQIHERAAALAGARGEQARQRELDAAAERLKALAKDAPSDPAALAARLDQLSTEAREAAGNASKQQPLQEDLGEVAGSAPPVPDYTATSDPTEVAAGAAQESLLPIQAAPKTWESYQQASEILSDAARQLRMDAALAQVDDLSPYPMPAEATPAEADIFATALAEAQGPMTGDPGKAITQPPPPGLDQAEWARLNELLRQAIRSSGIEHFTPEQQSAIRAYFERLSSEP